LLNGGSGDSLSMRESGGGGARTTAAGAAVAVVVARVATAALEWWREGPNGDVEVQRALTVIV
jgi:hypothetical protein